MTPEDRQRRASEAQRLLDEPLLKEALDAIEKEAIEAVLNGKPEDREASVTRANIVRDLRRRLELTIAMGKAASPSVA